MFFIKLHLLIFTY